MDNMKWLYDLLADIDNKEEIVEAIKEYICENYILRDDAQSVENDEYKGVIEKYEKQIEELKREIETERANAMLEKEILSQGGRNAKAILAIIGEGDILKDENGKVVGINLENAKQTAPYLFSSIEKKVEGTGATVRGIRKKYNTGFVESARKAAGIDK